jgi:hypothetical protein
MAMSTITSSMARPPEISLRPAAMAVVRAKLSPSRENHAAATPFKATAISPPALNVDSSKVRRNQAAAF